MNPRCRHLRPCRDQGSRSRSPRGSGYIEDALKAGLGIDDFAPQISFLFNCQIDFFEEIAKFPRRPARVVKPLRDRFGARTPSRAGCACTSRPRARR